jgi:flagellar motor switch protein FliN/FliY
MSDAPLSQDDIDAAMSAAMGAADDSGSGSAESQPEPAADAAPEAAVDSRVDSSGRPFDEAAAMMAAAIEEEKAAAAAQKAAQPHARIDSIPLPDFAGGAGNGKSPHSIDLLRDVNLHVKIELGRSRMLVEDVLKISKGAVVELDKLAGDPVDVLVNERLVARGEVLVLNDNFCVRISEILSPAEETPA